MSDTATRTDNGQEKKGTYSKRSRSVTGSSPSSTTVQSHTLIRNDLEETTATESFGVRLSLDLEDVQRKQNDLSDTDQTITCQKLDVSLWIDESNLPAVACMIALPVPFPKVLSKSEP
jgi:hypothetical protein